MSDVWLDEVAFAELAKRCGFETMPSRAARYSALLSYATETHNMIDERTRAAMCAKAVAATPVYSLTAYIAWGARPERARYHASVRERAHGLVACVALARERGTPLTPLAHGLASLPSGVLAHVGVAAAEL
jgi:hypothetical protein